MSAERLAQPCVCARISDGRIWSHGRCGSVAGASTESFQFRSEMSRPPRTTAATRRVLAMSANGSASSKTNLAFLPT